MFTVPTYIQHTYSIFNKPRKKKARLDWLKTNFRSILEIKIPNFSKTSSSRPSHPIPFDLTMSLSNRSGLRQKSSALLLNGLSSNTSATLNNSKSLALNGTGGDPVLPTPVSHPSATRNAIWDEDPCPWEDENIAPHLPSIMNGPTVSASTTTNPSNQSNSLNLAASISSSSAVNSANTVESLKYMAHKRITTFVYLKKAHEGKVNWFNTILLTKPELEKWFDPSRMQRRWVAYEFVSSPLPLRSSKKSCTN